MQVQGLPVSPQEWTAAIQRLEGRIQQLAPDLAAAEEAEAKAAMLAEISPSASSGFLAARTRLADLRREGGRLDAALLHAHRERRLAVAAEERERRPNLARAGLELLGRRAEVAAAIDAKLSELDGLIASWRAAGDELQALAGRGMCGPAGAVVVGLPGSSANDYHELAAALLFGAPAVARLLQIDHFEVSVQSTDCGPLAASRSSARARARLEALIAELAPDACPPQAPLETVGTLL